VRLINGVIGLSMLVLLPAVFLGAYFLHVRALGEAGIFLLAVYTASRAALEAATIWWVLHLGRWTGWKREPIWRHEKPLSYWTHTALHATILLVLVGASGLLIWTSGIGRLNVR
jgi:hypothetical protein